MNTRTWKLLRFSLLLGLAGLKALAQAEDYTFITNNGSITITGYIGPGGAVNIPNTINELPVTSVGGHAFDGNITLTSVAIPDSVTNIGDWAFFNCSSLTTVTISKSVTSLGTVTFQNCTNLTAFIVEAENPTYSSLAGVLFNFNQITLIQYPGGMAGAYTVPNSVTNILARAFQACNNLTSITIPDSVTIIEGYAFYGCGNLTSLTIGDHVSTIGDYAFYQCNNLTNVAISDRVTSIGNRAFFGCTGLTTVTMAAAATSIGEMAFYHCTSLTNLQLGNSAWSIGEDAFGHCTSLVKVTIPDSVTNIFDLAFENCASLSSITIGNNITFIGMGAFLDCTGLTDLTIGNSLKKIGPHVFYGCSSLVTVIIPNNVTNIADMAFANCYSLRGAFFNGKAPTSTSGVFQNDGNATVYYLVGNTGWGNTFGGRPTAIWDPQTHFGYRTNGNTVTVMSYFGIGGSIVVPDFIAGIPVVGIGTNVFTANSSVTGVTIPAGVTNIGGSAFSACTNLVSVFFLGNCPTAGSSMFSGTKKAIVYYLPGTTGWGSTFGGRSTALWLPKIQTGDTAFGVQNNQFGFNITWTSGMTIAVDACADFSNPTWSPLGTNTLTMDTIYFSDPDWTNYPARFYRIRSP